VTLESEPGGGATFHVRVPACRGEPEPEPAAPRAAASRGHGRILVMDDEEQVLAVVGRYLAFCGYEAQLTRDVEQLLVAFRQARREGRPFDAVIVDLTVPGGLGGREALARLRELDPDVRVVVSSGYSDDPVMADFRAHGFRGMLVKPYEVTDLDNLLRSVLHDPFRPAPPR
jgi:two-component system, cell cycle sensor histidine kinase and response regulator CckA